MGRLSNLKPRFGALAPRVTTRADAQGHRPGEVRDWYKSPEWQALRIRTFERDLYTCQLEGCGVLCVPGDPVTPPIADHKIPHRGDRKLFFAEDNVWTLCKPCHDGPKQRAEAAARRRGG